MPKDTSEAIRGLALVRTEDPVSGVLKRHSSTPCRTPRRDVRNVGPDALNVVFQPIVDLRDGRLFAVEALTRCLWAEYEQPPLLFDEAAQAGYAGQLGRHVRQVAFSRCDSQRIFVNLHPYELSEEWLVRPDDPLFFHEHGVYLEITESAAFRYYDLCVGVLKEVCSRAGACLVIDDLGAGYSNLKRISDLEPGVVKLDLALTRGIDQSRRQQILVRHVVALCIDLGAQVVAEGIETLDELSAIIDTGVHFGQGYLFARPAYPIPSIAWPRIQAPSRSRP